MQGPVIQELAQGGEQRETDQGWAGWAQTIDYRLLNVEQPDKTIK